MYVLISFGECVVRSSWSWLMRVTTSLGSMYWCSKWLFRIWLKSSLFMRLRYWTLTIVYSLSTVNVFSILRCCGELVCVVCVDLQLRLITLSVIGTSPYCRLVDVGIRICCWSLWVIHCELMSWCHCVHFR